VKSDFKSFLKLIHEVLQEAGRVSLYWLLILGLALPGPTVLAAPTATEPTREEVDADIKDKFEKLNVLVDQISLNRPTEGESLETLRSKAHSLAIELNTVIHEELNPLDVELTRAGESYKNKTYYYQDPVSMDRIWEKSYRRNDLWDLKHQLNAQTSKVGLSFRGKFLIDPNGKIEATNVGNAIILPDLSNKDTVGKETPAKIKESLKAWGAMGYHGAKHFSVQYANFSVAMGFMALSQLGAQKAGWVETTDPAAFENWEKQTINLLGAVGFGFFMLANHPIVNSYKNLRQLKILGQIPDSILRGLLINLGMTAGMLAQSLFQDMWTDKDLWQCVRPYYNSRAKLVNDSCQKMRANWLDNGKSLQYLPSILSMLAATPLATAARTAIGAAASKVGLDRARKSIIGATFAGGLLVHESKLGKIAMSGIAKLPGAFVAVGDFVLFLAISAHVTDEFIHDSVQHARMNHFDPNAWAAKTLDIHSDFFWPLSPGIQPFANALEVEATNAYSAHNYLMDFYRQMQANGWKQPARVEACVPKAEIEAAKKIDPIAAKDKWWFQNWWERSSHKKSQRQLTCEVFARPFELIERYAKVNSDWRTAIMNHFAMSVNNWIEMINQFSTVMNASRTLGLHLAEEKLKFTQKQGSTPAVLPDLSRAALAKAIGTELPSDDANAEEPHRVHAKFLDGSWFGSWVPTPELVDYVVAGFACGPDPKLDPKAIKTTAWPRFFKDVYSFFARQFYTESYFTTPWGSSTHFIPVKLTNKNRVICENISTSLYGNVNYMLGNPFPDLTGPQVRNPFTGPFTDGEQKYQTLVDYVFANMDPEIYKQRADSTGFPYWWNQNIKIPMIAVWTEYSKLYESFIQNKYLPKLFDRSFSGGCRLAEEMTKQTAKVKSSDLENFSAIPFADSNGKEIPGDKSDGKCSVSTAYRVANGYFLSLEVELRNFIRGVYSLYTSAFDKHQVSDEARAEFMEIAVAIIKGLQIVSPDILISTEEFEKNTKQLDEDLKQLFELVANRIKAKPSGDNAFREKMLGHFKEQITKLLTAQHQQVAIVNQLDLLGATNRSPVKKLDTSGSANPLRKGRD
jgi:hypothetical protein